MKRDIRNELLGQQDRLRPLEELVRSKGFQQWRAHVEEELKLLEEWSWNLVSTSDPTKLEKALAELGLVTPGSTEELRECWMSFRAARNYMRSKFEWLDRQVRKMEGVQKSLAKLDREPLKDGG